MDHNTSRCDRKMLTEHHGDDISCFRQRKARASQSLAVYSWPSLFNQHSTAASVTPHQVTQLFEIELQRLKNHSDTYRSSRATDISLQEVAEGYCIHTKMNEEQIGTNWNDLLMNADYQAGALYKQTHLFHHYFALCFTSLIRLLL